MSATRSIRYRSWLTTSSVPGPGVQQILQGRQGVGVQIVGRFVEHQHVGLVHQDPQQLQAATLATGQLGHPGPLVVLGEPETLGELAGGQRLATELDDPARSG